jgi:hypothetical protein
MMLSMQRWGLSHVIIRCRGCWTRRDGVLRLEIAVLFALRQAPRYAVRHSSKP